MVDWKYKGRPQVEGHEDIEREALTNSPYPKYCRKRKTKDWHL